MLRRLIAWAAAALALACAPLAHADQRAMVGVGTTTFAPSGAATLFLAVGSGGATTTVEAHAQTAWRGSETFSNFHVTAAANVRNTPTTLCIRKNGQDELCHTWGVSDTGSWDDTTSTISVVDGDLIDVAVTTGAGTGNFITTPLTWQVATTGATQVFTHFSSLGSQTNTGSRFTSTVGTMSISLTEANWSRKALEAATISNMTFAVAANANGSSFVITSRKNNGPGAQSITFADTETGLKEDTTHSDALAVDNVFSINKPATTSATYVRAGFKYTGQVPGRVAIYAGSGASATSGNTYFADPFRGFVSSGSQSQNTATIPFASTISKLTLLVANYAGTSNITVDILKNGNTTPVRTLTITGTGAEIGPAAFTDSSGAEDAFAAGDTIVFRISGQNATATIQGLSFLMTDTNAGGGGPPPTAAPRRLLTMGIGR